MTGMKVLLILFLVSYSVTWLCGVFTFLKNRGKVVEFRNVRVHVYLSLVT